MRATVSVDTSSQPVLCIAIVVKGLRQSRGHKNGLTLTIYSGSKEKGKHSPSLALLMTYLSI